MIIVVAAKILMVDAARRVDTASESDVERERALYGTRRAVTRDEYAKRCARQ